MSTGGNEGTGGSDWQPPDQGSYQPPPGQGTPPPPPDQWGAPTGGQQWQQPPYGGGPPGGQPIPNYLVWSILTTIFCCLPFGIVSIVFSTQVGSKQAQGDYAGAMDASRKAKTWAIASAVSGLVLTVAAAAFGLLGAIGVGSQSAGL